MQHMIAVGAVDDVYFMTMLRQRIGEAMQKDGVAAKTVRRIERGQMAEFKRSSHESRTPLRILR